MDKNVLNNKRIAKNTLFLYLRMGIMMVTSLFTSRIVLDALGVEDFGIYNLIGGIVVLFSFLNASLLTGTQRFLNYYLGQNDFQMAQRVFCMSLNIYFILGIVILILAETLGFWFLETQLNIPQERMQAAYYVYQFVVLTFLIGVMRIPYNAAIIAYERMEFYAYISMIEVILKLVLVYLLYITTFDKLIFYAFLYTLIPILITVNYYSYCKKNIEITHYIKFWDKDIFKSLFNFSGWSLFGSFANLSVQQGLNFLINIFYGVVVNAAAGIANQVVGTVYQFVSNFQTAFNPQIVKTYAAEQYENFQSLICRASKFSYYLILFIVLPLMCVMDSALSVWLVEVPKYTAIFCRLILLFFVIDAINAPLWMSIQATGNIRNYQILMSVIILLNLPISYIVLKLGYPVYTVWIVRIIVNIMTFIARCWYMKYKMNFPIRKFIYGVMRPIIFVTLAAVPLPIFIYYTVSDTYANLILTVLVSIVSVSIASYTLGLTHNEREFAMATLRTHINIFNRFHKNKE